MNLLEKQAYDWVKHDTTTQLWQDILTSAEKGALKAVLELTHGNQTEAAQRLNMHRSTLRERVSRYGLRGYGSQLKGESHART